MCLKLLFLVLESRQEAKWIGDNDQDRSYGLTIKINLTAELLMCVLDQNTIKGKQTCAFFTLINSWIRTSL